MGAKVWAGVKNRKCRSVILFLCFFLLSGYHCIEGAEKGYVKPRLAVMDFDTRSVDEATVQTITELTQSLLENSGLYAMVERSQITKIYEEQKLQYNGSVDESTAIHIGKMLGAEKLVLGSVNKLEKQLVITARIVDVETGAIEISGSKTGGLLDIRQCTGDLVKVLVEQDRREYERYAPSSHVRKGAIGLGLTYQSYFYNFPAAQKTVSGVTISQPEVINYGELVGLELSIFPTDTWYINIGFVPENTHQQQVLTELQPHHEVAGAPAYTRGSIFTGSFNVLHKVSKRFSYTYGVGLLKSYYYFTDGQLLSRRYSSSVFSIGFQKDEERKEFILGVVDFGIGWMLNKRLGLSAHGNCYIGQIPSPHFVGIRNDGSSSTYVDIDLYKPKFSPFNFKVTLDYYFNSAALINWIYF